MTGIKRRGTAALIAFIAAALSGCAYDIGREFSSVPAESLFSDPFRYHILSILFILASCIWIGMSVYRILNAYIRRIFLAVGFLIVGCALLQYFTVQLDPSDPLIRTCRYGSCFFQLSLPLMLLWLSLALDNTRERRYIRPMQIAALSVYLPLMLFAALNDLHMLLFSFVPADPFRYVRGPLYYIIFAASLIPFAASFVVLAVKARRTPDHPALLLPLFFGAALMLFAVLYAVDLLPLEPGDMVLLILTLLLLYLETAMRTGLIPVNRRYRALFGLSPLKMQIVDLNGARMLGSAASAPVDAGTWAQIRRFPGAPILQDKDTLLYTDFIPGGAVIWQEDIRALNRLEAEIRENVRRLKTANELLSREREARVQRTAAEEKIRLMTSLEQEIHTKTEHLSDLIRLLPEQEDKRLATGRITMLLCCIKRRCSLFFRERETLRIPADELAVYLDELAEFAEYAGVRLITSCSVAGDIPTRQATIFYDFFYAVLAACTQIGNASILAQLRAEENGFALMMLPSVLSADAQILDEPLRAAIDDAQGVVRVKTLDEDAVGFTLLFREGGTPRA